MELLSEDDQNLAGMTSAELDAAWDLWFDLAQHTNEFDPPYTHGVFQSVQPADADEKGRSRGADDVRGKR